MRRSKPPLTEWTKEAVCHWLMTEVKLQKSLSDKFVDEEVSGDILVDFEKRDLLDLGLKHGPVVKIIYHVERLKQATQCETQFPSYVKNWTKEQVNQWLLQHVKVYGKYAERLLEEDVSGDCLVCFRKPDLQDLEIKGGPATKILSHLHKLSSKPEPILEPTVHSTIQPELSHTQTEETKPPKSRRKPENVQNESEMAAILPEHDIQQSRPKNPPMKSNKTDLVICSSLLYI